MLPCLATAVLAMAGGIKDFPFPDAVEYAALGRSLADSFIFDAPNVQLCRRVPGYPFCLMLFSWLGAYNFLAVNLLFIFGLAWFGMLLAEKFEVKRPYLLPALLFLSPGIMTLSSVALSETAFSFFLVLCIYLLVNDKIFFSSLALSAATFCRPISIFLFLLFAAWLLWKKKKLAVILLFIIGANLLPVSWMTRNYLKYGYFTYTTLSNHYLLYYKAGSYLSWKNNIRFDDMRNQLRKQLKGDNEFERSISAGRLGRKILLDNFWSFCFWAPRDVPNFLMPDITPMLERLHITSGNRGTLDILRRQGLWAASKYYFNNNIPAMLATFIYLVFYSLVFATIIAGIVRLWLEKHYQKLIFGALLVAYFWVLPIGNLDWRFRMPVMPILFILAIYGAELLPKVIPHVLLRKK